MTSPRPAVQNSPANRRDLMWSRSEKAIAHKAFDAALERELLEVIQEAKQKAGQIKEQRMIQNTLASRTLTALPGEVFV
jgi:hypothetical protein